jgi:hypothetical protein
MLLVVSQGKEGGRRGVPPQGSRAKEPMGEEEQASLMLSALLLEKRRGRVRKRRGEGHPPHQVYMPCMCAYVFPCIFRACVGVFIPTYTYLDIF